MKPVFYYYRRNPSGFSLLQILVVVSILMVLAMLLTGIFRKGIQLAKQTDCVSNLREITGAYLLLIGDNQGKLSMFQSGTGSWADMWNLQIINGGYMTDRWRFYCPEIPMPSNYNPYNRNDWSWHTYGLNMFLPAGSAKNGRFNINYNIINNPSEYMLVTDTLRMDKITTGAGAHLVSSYTATTNRGIHLSHNDQTNISFLDGSIRSMDTHSLAKMGFLTVLNKQRELITTHP